jgi:hypothetical protein
MPTDAPTWDETQEEQTPTWDSTSAPPSFEDTEPDIAKRRVDEGGQAAMAGLRNPANLSFADYSALHPTETDLTIQALAPLAQTPEQQDQLGRFIASKKAPELETPGLAGQLWQTAWSAPKSTTEYVQTMQGIRDNEYQAVMDMRAKATAHGLDPDKVAPLPPVAERLAQGAGDAVEDLALTFQSPAGALTLGIGALPKAAQRVVSLGFAGQMLSQAPDTAQQLLAEIRKPDGERDYKKIAQLTVGGVADLGFGTLAGAHAAGAEIPGVKQVWNRANDYLDAKAGQAAQWMRNRPITPEVLPVEPAERQPEQPGDVVDAGEPRQVTARPAPLQLAAPSFEETTPETPANAPAPEPPEFEETTPATPEAPAPEAAEPAMKYGVPLGQWNEMADYSAEEQIQKWGTTRAQLREAAMLAKYGSYSARWGAF